MNNKKAFTLGEVLVTLMIIGVIASITIPGLKKTSDENSYVAGAHKAYSAMINATKLIKAKKGHIVTWNLASAEEITKLYKAEMNSIDRNSSDEKYPVTYLNGNAYTNKNMFDPKTSFFTTDGMLWYIQSTSADCSAATGTDLENGCVDWGVDVNGPNPPNTIGIDIFGFYLTKKDVYPEGSGGESFDKDGNPNINTSSCAEDSSGWGCSTKIILDKKISW